MSGTHGRGTSTRPDGCTCSGWRPKPRRSCRGDAPRGAGARSLGYARDEAREPRVTRRPRPTCVLPVRAPQRLPGRSGRRLRAVGSGSGDVFRQEEGRDRDPRPLPRCDVRQGDPRMTGAGGLPSAHIRLRLGQVDAHFGGHLVAAGTQLRIVGDRISELAMRYDGDEGLFRAYESVEFLAPLYAGDWIDANGKIVSVGTTSRRCEFEVWKIGAARTD